MSNKKKLLIIIGPPASGKMTVASEVCRKTNLKLFHNHMAIDPVLSVFDFGSDEFSDLVKQIRTSVFEKVLSSELEGVVFTFVWAFNRESGAQCISEWATMFKDAEGEVYMVELLSDLDLRLERNKGESRYLQKSSKRDFIKSQEILLKNEREWDMKAPSDFKFHDGFLSIDNSNLTAEQVSEIIIEAYKL